MKYSILISLFAVILQAQAGPLKWCIYWVVNVVKSEPKQVKHYPVESLPKNVAPALQQAIVAIFEVGPNRWVATGAKPKGVPFVSGFEDSDSSRSENHSASLSNKPLETGRVVFKVGGRKHDVSIWDIDRVMKIYAQPLAMQGRIAASHINEIKIPYVDYSTGIPAGVNISNNISQLGIFHNLSGTIYPSFSPEYIRWGSAYLKLFNEMKADGMIIDENSRGGKFTAELEALYSKGAPYIPYPLRTDDGSYDRFYTNNNAFILKLQEILNRYQ